MISPGTSLSYKIDGFVVCEWLKTVSLLKSELTKDKIKPKKLKVTKRNNCKKVRW